jgi:transposase-like protein
MFAPLAGCYYYRAIDKVGVTLLSKNRDEEAVAWFFKQYIENNGMPYKVSSIKV